MKERPIIFSAPMVRAILDGRKTQTRRVVISSKRHVGDEERVQRAYVDADGCAQFVTRGFGEGCTEEDESGFWVPPRYGRLGDRLWVREAFRLRADQNHKPPRDDWWKSGAWYEADGDRAQPSGCGGGAGKLRPSIHMPRWASRITLEVTDVRVERAQDIGETDAKAEGAPHLGTNNDGHRGGFRDLWNAINFQRGYGWRVNPWVWAVTFRRVDA